jgi:hypothetical protein
MFGTNLAALLELLGVRWPLRFLIRRIDGSIAPLLLYLRPEL